jgi:hypothetical protein
MVRRAGRETGAAGPVRIEAASPGDRRGRFRLRGSGETMFFVNQPVEFLVTRSARLTRLFFASI